MSRSEVLSYQPPHYQAQEWSYGINDFDCVNRFDPTAYFCCVVNGEITATTCVVKWDETYAFAGSLLVQAEHRGKGYGSKLMYYMKDTLGDRNIGADAMNSQWGAYELNGFKKAYDHDSLHAVAKHIDHPLHKNVRDLATVPLDDVAAYDAQHFPVPRRRFLEIWLQQPKAVARGYLLDGKLLGYGLIRPGWPEAQVGPLFASSVEIASALLSSLTNTLNVGDKYELGAHTPNPNVALMSTPFGFEKCYSYSRMYNKRIYQVPDACIYSSLSTDIG
jgi:GNAT superfamily N-acetyltransferase